MKLRLSVVIALTMGLTGCSRSLSGTGDDTGADGFDGAGDGHEDGAFDGDAADGDGGADGEDAADGDDAAVGDGGTDGADGDGASGEPEGACALYLSCVGVANPEGLPAALAAYGPGAVCWSVPGLPAHDCQDACRTSLTALALVHPTVAACTARVPEAGDDVPLGDVSPADARAFCEDSYARLHEPARYRGVCIRSFLDAPQGADLPCDEVNAQCETVPEPDPEPCDGYMLPACEGVTLGDLRDCYHARDLMDRAVARMGACTVDPALFEPAAACREVEARCGM